jgi:threonine dehydrogenase-like Zn-dependent dehydrogenase
VIGAGLIGLLAVQLGRVNGALPAITVDLQERRLDFARRIGVDAAVEANDEMASNIARLSDPVGAAVVVEATGHPQAILTALDLVRPGGRVVLLGSTRGETDHVNFYRDVHRKGVTLIGAHNIARPHHESHPGWWTEHDDQRVALQLLALQRLTVQPLITHRFSWQQAPQAYELLKTWDLNALGMLLNWRP